MNAWAAAFGAAWGAAWGIAPPPVIEEPRLAGAGQRIEIRHDLSVAARRLAEDNDAVLVINVILASGVLDL